MLSKFPLFGTFAVLLFLAGCGGGSNSNVPAASPAVTLSANSLSFSAIVGQMSASQVITLSDSGTATLSISSVTLGDSNDYTLANGCGASLTVGASCTLTVSFKPQTAASLPSTITIADNASGSPQTITLSGAGTAVPVPTASLAPSSLSFASTPAGTTSAALPITVSNIGSAALTVTSVAIAGTNPTNFSQTNNCTSVAAGSSCTVNVVFKPTAAAASYTANVTVTDNTGGAAGSTQTVTASGTGATVALATLAPGSLSFSAPLNTAAGAQTVTLSNPGSATLTGIVISLSGSASFSDTTTCGTTLAAAANCALAVNFTPTAAGTVTGTLSVQDSATNSPQTVGLTGAGAVPVASLSATTITFPTTTIATTSPASSVTLTNTGSATLTISSIVLGGTNAGNFTETNNCGLTLAPNAFCTISGTFSPAAATAYSATVTITDTASGSPQTVTFTGSGTTSTVSHTLLVFPETDNSVTPLYALVNAAQKTIDMTMYALEDTTFSGDLVAACNRGVKVRVILDQALEKSGNTPAYNQLNAVSNCSAVWANLAYQASHQKSIILDGAQVAVMSLNLQSQYYSTTRDFALIENDSADIASIQATFNADYVAGTPSSGVAGASDFSYIPTAGDNDLIWSPTTAQAAMLAIINNAKATLLVENEEMGAANIVTALENACTRGVSVKIAMVNQSSYASNFSALEAAGCGVHVYPNTQTGFYIHAKAVVADFGLSTQSVYMGSINYSLASMNQNRELGIYIFDSASVSLLNTTMTSDYAGGTVY